MTMIEHGAALQAEANALPWHHQLDFGDGILSPGNTKIDVLRAQADIYFPDIRGKSMIDVGCWDGFNSFEAHRRGAARVLATDHYAWSDQCWGDRRSFELGRRVLAPAVEVRDIDPTELSVESVGTFDVVLFAGVFYHLRHPFLILEKVASLAIETLIIETHIDALDESRPAMVFYPGDELAGDWTNWWGPNVPCVEAMMRDSGFSTLETVMHPIYPNRAIFTGRR